MYEITRNHKRADLPKHKVYKIYTEEEAKEKGIEYKHWKEVEVGDQGKWCLSDDGYVAEVIAVKQYKPKYQNRLAYDLYLPYTRKFVTKIYKGEKVEFLPHWKTQCWRSTPNENWENSLKGRRWRSFARVWALMTINGYVDYNLLGKIVKPYHRVPEWYATKKLKNAKVEKICMRELTKLLEERGAGQGETIDMILKAAKYAEGAKSSKDMLAVAKTLAEMHGMEPKKVRTTEKIEGDFEGMLDRGSVKGNISGERTTESTEVDDGN